MNMATIPASRKGHPYYIYAPPYRETSAGIVVLHTLCHALNVEGHEAYIIGTDVVNPDFDTPLATPDVRIRHKVLGLEPVAVYPEVVSGNPMNADVCVRYILNKIGYLTGKPLGEGKDDLFFYYSENFLGDAKKTDVDFLFLPVLDTELFKPDPSRKKRPDLRFSSTAFHSTKSTSRSSRPAPNSSRWRIPCRCANWPRSCKADGCCTRTNCRPCAPRQ